MIKVATVFHYNSRAKVRKRAHAFCVKPLSIVMRERTETTNVIVHLGEHDASYVVVTSHMNLLAEQSHPRYRRYAPKCDV